VRETHRERDTYSYIYIYTYIYTRPTEKEYIYIYIYISIYVSQTVHTYARKMTKEPMWVSDKIHLFFAYLHNQHICEAWGVRLGDPNKQVNPTFELFCTIPAAYSTKIGIVSKRTIFFTFCVLTVFFIFLESVSSII